MGDYYYTRHLPLVRPCRGDSVSLGQYANVTFIYLALANDCGGFCQFRQMLGLKADSMGYKKRRIDQNRCIGRWIESQVHYCLSLRTNRLA